jgi:hypothetical protein
MGKKRFGHRVHRGLREFTSKISMLSVAKKLQRDESSRVGFNTVLQIQQLEEEAVQNHTKNPLRSKRCKNDTAVSSVGARMSRKK